MIIKSVEGSQTSIGTFLGVSKIKFSTIDSRLTLTLLTDRVPFCMRVCVYICTYVCRTCCLTLTVITQEFNASQHQIQHVNICFKNRQCDVQKGTQMTLKYRISEFVRKRIAYT